MEMHVGRIVNYVLFVSYMSTTMRFVPMGTQTSFRVNDSQHAEWENRF